MRLGKQAREDGAQGSDNVVGDIVEALIGAVYLDSGYAAAEGMVRRLWADLIEDQESAPKHPKSALQEWAAAKGRRPPAYEVVGRSGPQHAPSFIVSASIPGANRSSHLREPSRLT